MTSYLGANYGEHRRADAQTHVIPLDHPIPATTEPNPSSLPATKPETQPLGRPDLEPVKKFMGGAVGNYATGFCIACSFLTRGVPADSSDQAPNRTDPNTSHIAHSETTSAITHSEIKSRPSRTHPGTAGTLPLLAPSRCGAKS